MKYRRVKILEEMFRDIAQPEEIKKVDELYGTAEKGLAIVYMLRKIKPFWDRFIEESSKQKSFDLRFENEIKIKDWRVKYA